VTIRKDKCKKENYNWLDVLIRHAQIAATFAGFCITFIVLVIGGKLTDIDIYSIGATFGQFSVMLFGTSAALFIFSSQRFLQAQEHNLWELPNEYKRLIHKKHGPFTDDQWEELLLKGEKKCRQYEKEGRYAYNVAVIVMTIGLFWAVAPYHMTIAVLVTVLGLTLEAFQILR
jgi:hypothetical protein